MIAVSNHRTDDQCCTCGHFPRQGYYVVGTRPQCRECYERGAARMLHRDLGDSIPVAMLIAGSAAVPAKSKYLPG